MSRNLTKILIALISVLILLEVILFFLGVNIDKTFLVETLKGVFSNTLVFFVAIFCIDLINKDEQKRKLKRINKQNSEFIFIKTTALFFVLGEQISIFTAEQIGKEGITLLDIKKPFISAEAEKSISNSTVFSSQFCKTYNEAGDKIKFLENFCSEAKKFIDLIQDSLKKIYPHQSDNVDELMEKIQFGLGVLSAPLETMKITKELKGAKQLIEAKISDEEFEKFEKAYINIMGFMYKMGPFEAILQGFFINLNELRQMAKEDKLFSDI